ncbi:proline-, glutamic acid- and leucine-rich protein 1-like isoform X3 [Oncorhynchus mykiss]|uniref:proline-, glutamic acid- and leucine-rich protein 1-like isoform X3 n=1 Tax=Oncorhynchus mykiss TaxID=8022 RepID=UPI0018786B8C|nr:proline-, glutamic acid- and leucine-rich protein 1-like isoform X3 [Oncorhynchus mykiss]
MSSLSYSPDKEEVVGWTEKEALMKEEEAVTVKQEVEDEVVTVKEEEKDVTVKEEDVTVKEEEEAFRVKVEQQATVFGVKEEEGELTVTVEEVFEVKEEGEITVTLDEEEGELEKTGNLINTRERPDAHSDSGKSPSGEPDPETPKPARQHHCSHCGKSFTWRETGLLWILWGASTTS